MMETRNGLLYIRPELLEDILQSLLLDDLKNLRLVCRHLSQQLLLRQHFTRFFERQTTNLASESLSSLEALSRHETFGSLVRQIRVVAESYTILTAEAILSIRKYWPPDREVWVPGTAEQLAQTAVDLHWMRRHAASPDAPPEAEAVDRLAAVFSRCGSLSTLELDARFVEGPGRFVSPSVRHIVPSERQPLWVRASQVYRLAMTALARSGAAISNLCLYSSSAGCCVPSYDISVGLPGLVDAGLARGGASVRELALCFATRVDHGWTGWELALGVDVGRRERRFQRRQFKKMWAEGPPVLHEFFSAEVVVEEEEEEEEDVAGRMDDESDCEIDARIEEEKASTDCGRYTDTYPQVTCADNFPEVAGLLGLMPHLEALDLRMHQTLLYEWGYARLRRYDRVFGALVEREAHLPQLRRLTLRGVCIQGDDLLRFMERHHRIEELELRNVFLLQLPPSLIRWHSLLEELRVQTVSNANGRGALARLLLSDLVYLGSGRDEIRFDHESNTPTNLWSGGTLRQAWRDRGWGVSCQCGNSVMLSTCELFREDMARPGCFDFRHRSTLHRGCSCEGLDKLMPENVSACTGIPRTA